MRIELEKQNNCECGMLYRNAYFRNNRIQSAFLLSLILYICGYAFFCSNKNASWIDGSVN